MQLHNFNYHNPNIIYHYLNFSTWPMYALILVFVFFVPCKLDSHGALGSSDVVILLHGFPTSSYDWNKVRNPNLSY